MKQSSKKREVKDKIVEYTVGAVGAVNVKRRIQRARGPMSVGRSSATEKAGGVRTPAEKASLTLQQRQAATKGTGFTATTTTGQQAARRAGIDPATRTR